MTNTPIVGRLLAAGLCLLLMSCGVARTATPGPASARELGRYVLVLDRAPDGQMTHSWQPVESFTWAAHSYLAASRHLAGRGVQVAFTRDCEEERDGCESMCLASLTGRDWSHMSVGSKQAHCRQRCRQPYLDCHKLKESVDGNALEFHAMDEAVAWLESNSQKLWAGAVVVIAGVTFVVVVGGSGGAVLLLVPVIVLASAVRP